MTDPFTRFDRDPDALAWARSKVQAEVGRAQAFGEEAAAAAHDPEQSEVWRCLASRMQRVLVGGKGCVHGAFDERLPELVAEVDALRAAEPTAPAADELAPPAPQEPTVTTFRRKPLTVEAWQVVGSKDGSAAREVAAWCGGWPGGSFEEPHVIVPTLEGNLRARAGDWIVRGVRGEFHPVRGDIFAELYEPVVAS